MAIVEQIDILKPEIWSPRVTRYFRENLVAAKAFTDVSSELAAGGEKLHLPHVPVGGTMSDIPTTSGNMTGSNIITTRTTLEVDKWKGTVIRLSDFDLAQIAKVYSIRNIYAQDLGFQLSRTFDSALIERAVDSSSKLIGDSGTELNATNLELAMAYAASSSIPLNELRMILHPKSFYVDLFKNAKFYDAAVFGLPTIPGGQIPALYGIPIIQTPMIPLKATGSTARANLLVHPRGMAYAFGQIPGMAGGSARLELTRGPQAKRYNIEADLMYGLTAWRKEGLITIRSKA